MVTAVIGDVASYFGCTLGIKDSVTAVAFVALGTSIPGKLNDFFLWGGNRRDTASFFFFFLFTNFPRDEIRTSEIRLPLDHV